MFKIQPEVARALKPFSFLTAIKGFCLHAHPAIGKAGILLLPTVNSSTGLRDWNKVMQEAVAGLGILVWVWQPWPASLGMGTLPAPTNKQICIF